MPRKARSLHDDCAAATGDTLTLTPMVAPWPFYSCHDLSCVSLMCAVHVRVVLCARALAHALRCRTARHVVAHPDY
jgi:hypothetical protein